MKRILLIIAALSVLLFSFGTAHAVIGLNDDVPGMDVVAPFICEFTDTTAAPTVFVGLDTLTVIGDVKGQNLQALIGAIAGQIDIATLVGLRMSLTVYNNRSDKVFDTTRDFTFRDIVGDSACDIALNQMSAAQRASMAVTAQPSGKKLFAGYALYQFESIVIQGGNQMQLEEIDPQVFSILGAIANRFASWIYLTDTQKGMASEFNGFNAEFGVDTDPATFASKLNEGGFGKLRPAIEQILESGNPITLNQVVFDGLPVFATRLYPRWFVPNDNPETANWWIFIFGTNSSSRALNGVFCDESEHCTSMQVPVTTELSIVDVASIRPASVKDKGGMGLWNILVSGGNLLAPDDNLGLGEEALHEAMYLESNNPNLCDFAAKFLAKGDLVPNDQLPEFTRSPRVKILNPNNGNVETLGINYGSNCVTVLGWSYQRVQVESATLSWDGVHPITRNQCNGFDAFGCGAFSFARAFEIDVDDDLRNGADPFFPFDVCDPDATPTDSSSCGSQS